MKTANTTRTAVRDVDAPTVPAYGRGPRALFDLNRINQFVVVARHLNITRAARQLHLSQQAVSGTIKSIERDLGVNLFERVGRGIELTHAGAALRDGATPLLDAAAALARTIQDSQRRHAEAFEVVCTPEIAADEVIDLTASVRAAYPLAPITVRQVLPGDIASELREGRADVGLCRGEPESDQLASVLVGHSPLRVAVSTAHRLADNGTVTLADLADDTLILPGTPDYVPYAVFLLSVCRQAGIEPATVTTELHGIAPTAAVIGTDHFTFVTAGSGRHHHARVSVLDLADKPLAPTHALWLPHTHNPLRHALLGDLLTARDASLRGNGMRAVDGAHRTRSDMRSPL